MRLSRMAAGRRVSGQAMRVRCDSVSARLVRRAILSTSRKWHISLAFARAAAVCSMWHAACNHTRRRTGRAQFGMFTQRVRGGWRCGFLLGAARRGVAF